MHGACVWGGRRSPLFNRIPRGVLCVEVLAARGFYYHSNSLNLSVFYLPQVWMVGNHSAEYLERYEFYLFLLSLPASLFLQLFYLNSALRQMDSLETVPVYQCSIIIVGEWGGAKVEDNARRCRRAPMLRRCSHPLPTSAGIGWGWIFSSEFADSSGDALGLFVGGALISCVGVALLLMKKSLLSYAKQQSWGVFAWIRSSVEFLGVGDNFRSIPTANSSSSTVALNGEDGGFEGSVPPTPLTASTITAGHRGAAVDKSAELPATPLLVRKGGVNGGNISPLKASVSPLKGLLWAGGTRGSSSHGAGTALQLGATTTTTTPGEGGGDLAHQRASSWWAPGQRYDEPAASRLRRDDGAATNHYGTAALAPLVAPRPSSARPSTISGASSGSTSGGGSSSPMLGQRSSSAPYVSHAVFSPSGVHQREVTEEATPQQQPPFGQRTPQPSPSEPSSEVVTPAPSPLIIGRGPPAGTGAEREEDISSEEEEDVVVMEPLSPLPVNRYARQSSSAASPYVTGASGSGSGVSGGSAVQPARPRGLSTDFLLHRGASLLGLLTMNVPPPEQEGEGEDSDAAVVAAAAAAAAAEGASESSPSPARSLLPPLFRSASQGPLSSGGATFQQYQHPPVVLRTPSEAGGSSRRAMSGETAEGGDGAAATRLPGSVSKGGEEGGGDGGGQRDDR